MSDFKFLCKMGEGFYNLSVDFAVAPFTNIRNQMSFIKLKSGRFLVVDTCVFSAEVKREIDELTNNGELIDAVIGTHPYHTGGFAPFMKLYPGVPLWIGAPRHLLVCTGMYISINVCWSLKDCFSMLSFCVHYEA